MEEFGSCLLDCGLLDAGYEGNDFTWTNEGDRNTRYYQLLLKKKRIKNFIWTIQNDDGSILNDALEIKRSAVDYFSALLTKDNDINVDSIANDWSFIPKIITEEDNNFLTNLPDRNEVRTVVFECDANSVAGPDGFSGFFYQHCWDIIGEDLVEAVIDFFNGGAIPKGASSTTIVLIPKVPHLKTWSDFRPISLCTMFNKIITKILTNRLSRILPKIILPFQSGFIPGRRIEDNILLAQEMVQSIDEKTRGSNVILKLDMMKAYDRIDWTFIIKIMHTFGFCSKMTDMIENCISNCWFSVLLNGETTGYFHGSRGLRQEVPLFALSC
ncbi:REVERSE TRANSCRIPTASES [Salix koriyanagi]|uniref:REVERSE TRANSCRIPTASES n=1 Tax=Salix koriyanagi TaxID=2511006 RepID=A0A9Q0X2I7_9ROSI|nr:REVERSE TRANSCRIPTASES [Salix koriyanagi]